MRALPCKRYRAHDNPATQGRVDVATFRMYIFHWDEAKAKSNYLKHGLDFRDAWRIFAGPTLTREDKRFAYGEMRFLTLGLLAEIPVCITHTHHENTIRLISMRKATRREAEDFFAYGPL